MNWTDDCSTKITGEHYFSRSILEVLGKNVSIAGVPWLPNGERKILGVDRLTAKILCDRHNSRLAPLDGEAGNFFKALHGTQLDAQRQSLSTRRQHYLFSGETIELWMLKAAAGMYYSGNASIAGAKIKDYYSLSTGLLEAALLWNHWAPGCGMYIRAPVGHIVDSLSEVEFAPIFHPHAHRMVGAGIRLTGLEFALMLDLNGSLPPSEAVGWYLRPSELHFHVQRRVHVIGMTWPVEVTERSIRLDIRPKTSAEQQ